MEWMLERSSEDDNDLPITPIGNFWFYIETLLEDFFASLQTERWMLKKVANFKRQSQGNYSVKLIYDDDDDKICS